MARLSNAALYIQIHVKPFKSALSVLKHRSEHLLPFASRLLLLPSFSCKLPCGCSMKAFGSSVKQSRRMSYQPEMAEDGRYRAAVAHSVTSTTVLKLDADR